MLVNEPVIAIIFQKIYTMLPDYGCNQTVNRVADRYPFAPEVPVDSRTRLESGTVVFEIECVFNFESARAMFIAGCPLMRGSGIVLELTPPSPIWLDGARR